jgi:glycosyltransferase involved in cell wall biosynthesis
MRWIVPAPRDEIECRDPPTFSIVIPAYQAAGTVGDAVRSALAQTRPAHEVIVVDDGSTDDVARALSEFDGQITLIRKEHGGAASALNTGLQVAMGEFVAILDADDVYHPRRIEAMAELAASRPDLDIVTTDVRFVVDGQAAGRFNVSTPFEIVDQRRAILNACFVGGSPGIRLSRLRAIGGFDESFKTGQDWDCAIRLILDGAVAGLVDEPYLEYHLHADSLTTNRVAALWDRVRVLEKAAQNTALREDERPELARSLLRHRTRAALVEADFALSRGDAARSRLLQLAASRGVTTRARALLAVAALAPQVARRWVPRDTPPLQRESSALRA